ncbi:MAG: aldo/keto reductase [Fulvivirga sp.]|nr:aldo/keto reductase [Fulvivirga sp.]
MKNLKPVAISDSNLKLSPLVLGMWHIHELAADTFDILIKNALEVGITTFDHADIYGDYQCEKIFGKWLKNNKSDRQSIQLVSKCGIKLISSRRPEHRVKHYDTSAGHIIASAEKSLKNLKAEYLDLLLIHRPDPLLEPEEVSSAFDRLQHQGKVKFFGVSNFTAAQFQMLQHACDMPLVTNQLEISLSNNQPMFDGTLDYFLSKNIQPMAWSPLGGREKIKKLVAAKQVKELAVKYNLEEGNLLISWLLQHPAGIIPVLGTMNPQRVASAPTALGITWDKQDWFALLELARGERVP